MKNFSVYKNAENSVFVWSSYKTDFSTIPEVNDHMSVFITNGVVRDITIYDTHDFTDEDMEALITKHVGTRCLGLNYKYKLVKKVGNTYFFE